MLLVATSIAAPSRADELRGVALVIGQADYESLNDLDNPLNDARAMDDLLAHDVTVLTLGQYLRPTPKHLPVVEYVAPEVFDEYKQIALEKGFRHVASGPLVRSSYHAADFRPEMDVLDAIDADVRAHQGLEVGPEHLPLPAANPSLVKAIA